MTPEIVRTWSEPKRSTAVAALLLAVKGDGRLEQTETKELMAVLAKSGLEDLKRLEAAEAKVSPLRTTQAIVAFGKEAATHFTTPTEQQALCAAMLKLAFADGLFQPQEQQVIQLFASGLGIAAQKLEELAGQAADTSAHAAAAKGRVSALEALLASGVSPNLRDANQWTPLHVAVACGQAAVVDLLLKRGADLDARHAQGSPPLFNACNKPYAAIVEKLLAAGANANATGVQNLTALHIATMANQLEVAKALHKGGAKLETADANGRTALHCAASEGRAEVLRWLLSAGANVEAKASAACTPLHFAATKGDVACITALLEAKAKLEAADADGQTAVHYAARNRPKALALLLERKANPAAASTKGVTPLHVAAASGFTTCAKQLLDAGAPIDARNIEGGTPLFGAAVHDRRDVYDLLVSRGADPSAKTTSGTTPEGSRGAAKAVRAPPHALEDAKWPSPAPLEALQRHDDWQLAVWMNDDRSRDQVLVAGRDRRGRPEYVSARAAKTDPRSRFFVVQQNGRRLLALFTSEAAAAAFRKRVPIGWPEDGLGIAAAVTGTMPASLFRTVADLPVDGALVNPLGPDGPWPLTLEDCDTLGRP